MFLSVDHPVRMQRLHARELTRYGDRIRAGRSLEGAHREFMEWADGYEDPGFDGRSRARHEEWLRALTCPVLRLDGTRPLAELVAELAASA